MTWLPLKRVADVSPSNVDKITVEGERPVRLVNYTDVYYGDRLHPGLDLMAATATSDEIAKFRLQSGDVILTKDSETADDIGISAYVDEASEDMVCGYHLSLVRPRAAVGRYLHYALSSTHARRQMSVAATGVTRFGLRSESVSSLSIWLPSEAEQRTISDYLDAETARIDALIAKKQQLIHLLEERWGSELTNLLRLDSDQVALQRLFEPTIGGSWGSEPGTAEVDAACVRGTDFNMGTLRVGDSCPLRGYTHADLGSKSLRPGDLVIEKSGGGDNQPVGRVVLFAGHGPAIPTNFAARLRPMPGSSPAYLTFLLNAAYRLGITRSWIKQTTGIQNLDLGGLLSEKVPIARLAVQHELLDRLAQSEARLRSTSDRLRRQIDLLAEHRQALITAAVTGEFAVPGAA